MSDISENIKINAFLYMIRYSEGTLAGGYNTLFGGKLWRGGSGNHPANLGWMGLPLSDAHCRGAGLSPGCRSTAAGAYQFVKPTWNRLARKLALPDFSPDSQDKAALELIREAGAYQDVIDGNFVTAVNKVRKIWASLPGAGYGQGERSITALTKVYNNAVRLFT